jgi:hypothetical protein
VGDQAGGRLRPRHKAGSTVRRVALSWCVLIGVFAFAAAALSGNGAPSGTHYNLNIIGVENPKTADMTGTSGKTIFVSLQGRSTIWLCESGVDTRCEDPGFYVVDRNATDNDGALFALPNPDPDGDGTTVYSVFARALGTPGGGAGMKTYMTDPSDGSEICSVITLELKRDKGKSTFDNVSKYLLYVYADTDGDGVVERVPLFDKRFQDFLWYYANTGLKLAQLRFYECASTVPLDPNGPTTDVCGRTGNT